MIDDVPSIVPHVAASTPSMPAPEVPPGESQLPAPTAEQAQMADRVFARSGQAHPVASLVGIAASVMVLRDVAVDTFDTSDEEDEDETQKQPRNDSKD